MEPRDKQDLDHELDFEYSELGTEDSEEEEEEEDDL